MRRQAGVGNHLMTPKCARSDTNVVALDSDRRAVSRAIVVDPYELVTSESGARLTIEEGVSNTASNDDNRKSRDYEPPGVTAIDRDRDICIGDEDAFNGSRTISKVFIIAAQLSRRAKTVIEQSPLNLGLSIAMPPGVKSNIGGQESFRPIEENVTRTLPVSQ